MGSALAKGQEQKLRRKLGNKLTAETYTRPFTSKVKGFLFCLRLTVSKAQGLKMVIISPRVVHRHLQHKLN